VEMAASTATAVSLSVKVGGDSIILVIIGVGEMDAAGILRGR
jgi:hypothetical protein